MSSITHTDIKFEDHFLEFTSSFYGEIEKINNTCVSPYSVATALLLLMLGTRGQSRSQISTAVLNNTTLSDIENMEKFKQLNAIILTSNTKGLELKVANKLFVSNRFTLKPEVTRNAKKIFNSEIGYKDFSKSETSATFMNQWVAKITNNRIKKLILASWLNSMTVMVLVNVVYFKGEWKTKFDPSNTKPQDFYINKSTTIKVDMMHVKQSVMFFSDVDYSAIAIPYKGDTMDMVFMLPRQLHGLEALEKRLSPKLLNDLASGFKPHTVQISIPKFVMETEVNLKTILPKLGVIDIFDINVSNFSELVEEASRQIYVSQAIHKVYVEVNEEGTEAAAATAGVVLFRAVVHEITFIANHPFLFYIRHKQTGIILFIGRYSP